MNRILRALCSGSRPFIALHYLFPTVFGIFIGYHKFSQPVHFLPCALVTMAVFFSFQASVILNDLYDVQADSLVRRKTPLSEGTFSRRAYQRLGFGFFILALIAAAADGYRIMLIVIAGNILHLLYSVPPFRLKRIYPLSIITLALGAVLTAIAGYAVYEPARPFLSFPGRAALFIFIPLLLALNFRDLADYEGDRQTGTSSLYTLAGLEHGRIVNGVLMLLSYIAVPVILGYPLLFIATLPLGLASLYVCLRKPFNEKHIFYIYFILVVILTVVLNLNPAIVIRP